MLLVSGVDRDVPVEAAGEVGQGQAVGLPVHVDTQVDDIVPGLDRKSVV